MNRHVSEPGWPDEANRNPERIWLDHVYHLYEIIDELRRRHPNVAFDYPEWLALPPVLATQVI